MLSSSIEASWVSEIWGPFLSVKLSIAECDFSVISFLINYLRVGGI